MSRTGRWGALTALSAAAVVVLLVVGLLGDGTAKPVVDPASADEPVVEGPAPGEPGPNPCLNREEQTPEQVKAYYALAGQELKRHGANGWGKFVDNEKWVARTRKYVDRKIAEAPRVPKQSYSAFTFWCPGFDVDGNGARTERLPELVSERPLSYKAGKAYHVLFENDQIIVAVLKDCHNLIIILKQPPPSQKPPGKQPPTTATTRQGDTTTTTEKSTTTTRPRTGKETPPTTVAPPPTTAAPPQTTTTSGSEVTSPPGGNTGTNNPPTTSPPATSPPTTEPDGGVEPL